MTAHHDPREPASFGAPMSKPRPPQPSLPTNLIQMTPDFLAALQAVAPKKKRSRLWYLVPVVLLAAFAVVAATPAARTFVVGKVTGRAAQPSASIAAAPASVPAVADAPAATPTSASTTLLAPAPTSTTLLAPAPTSTTLLAPSEPAAPAAAVGTTAPPVAATASAPTPPAPPPPATTGRRKSKWQR